MKIYGFEKLTLLDYPEKVACTIFLGGCNFRCPFCQNRDLVLYPERCQCLDEEEVFRTLDKRRGILEGVCITGGEPCIQKELPDFIRKIRQMGYAVKLDTNGYEPDVLQTLVNQRLLDYVAMDVKATPEKYPQVTGKKDLDVARIKTSVAFLLQGTVPYEFRTTVCRELHTVDDFEKIGQWLKGCSRYYLQAYRDSETVIERKFSSYSTQELKKLRNILKKYMEVVEIRGVNVE